MIIQISEDALDDLNEGFLFYEAQASGLGDYFTSCLRADIEGLRFSAGVHRIVEADYHPTSEPGFSIRYFLYFRATHGDHLGGC